jgi:ABC-type nitrate/sulfonate/bicarbonate transport system permease component
VNGVQSRPRAGRRLVWAYGPSAVFLALLVLAWEVLVRVLETPHYIVPAPSRIWQAFWETKELLPDHIQTTFTQAVLGLMLGATAGVVIAVLVAGIPLVRRVVMPLLVSSQTIPIIVLAPLLMIWFGFGMTPKILLVALWGFFPIAVATADGLANADREMAGLVRSMGGSRLQVLWNIAVPGAVPAFFSGLKIAAAYSVGGAVVGEWIGASSGLGLYITRAQASFRIDRVFVAVVLIAALSILLFAVVHMLARLATPWKYVKAEEETT